MLKSKTYVLLLGLLISTGGLAQKLNISDYTIAPDGTVTFTAIIEKNFSDRERYSMSVLSSADNFVRPLNITFDDLEPGKAHQMEFNGNQVGAFQGDISFKFELKASVFPVKISESSSATLRQGKNFNVSWQDFSNAGSYKIELLRNGNLLQVLNNNFSGTSYSGELPSSVEKGENYSLRVTPTSNELLASEPFGVNVKGKIGLALKLAPLGAAGIAGVIIALSGGGGGDSTVEDTFPSVPSTP